MLRTKFLRHSGLSTIEMLMPMMAFALTATARYHPRPPPPAASGTTEVRTPDGTLRVEIVRNPNTTKGGSWLRARGVKYAQDPVDALRFAPPQPFGRWDGVLNATSFGANCVQAPLTNALASIGFTGEMSERCLFLNVWAPIKPAADDSVAEKVPAALLPVLFWMYGGSFTEGGTTLYPADSMLTLDDNAIVVSVNYRLGALGWLGGDGLASVTPDHSSGNWGLQDTREALVWVARNIGAFGGDPQRVTIFGESAGSSLVATHLAAKRSSQLFNGAIMESGAFDNFTTQSDPNAGFANFVELAHCTDRAHGDAVAEIACLRAKPILATNSDGLWSALTNTSYMGWFSPCVDGVELTAPPEVYAARGELNHVDHVIVGSNLNEGNYLMPLAEPMNNAPHSTLEDLDAWLATYFVTAATIEEIQTLYAHEITTLTPWEVASMIYTEQQYTCPTSRSARWLVNENGVENVFVYELLYAPSMMAKVGEIVDWLYFCVKNGRGYNITRCHNATVEPFGVAHTADVYLVWNDPRLNATTDRLMANKFVQWWQSVAATSDPNDVNKFAADQSQSAPSRWPKYGSANATFAIDVADQVVLNLKAERCAFWDAQHVVPYSS